MTENEVLGAMLRRALLGFYPDCGPYWDYDGASLLIDGYFPDLTPDEQRAMEALKVEDRAARAAHDAAQP